MKARQRFVLVLVLLGSLVAAPLRAAEDPVGTWVGTTEVPNQGTDQVTLTIEKAGEGYTGTMSDSLGVVAQQPLREIRFADGALSFAFMLTDGTPMTMRLTVTGDKMAGQWQTPEDETGAITFERKKS